MARFTNYYRAYKKLARRSRLKRRSYMNRMVRKRINPEKSIKYHVSNAYFTYSTDVTPSPIIPYVVYTYNGTNWGITQNQLINTMTFTLSQVPNANEFTALYDSYRINKIVVKIIPKFNVTGTQNDITNQDPTDSGSVKNTQMIPRIHTAIDYNSSIPAPTTYTNAVQYVSQYMTYKTTNGYREHVRTIYKPKCKIGNPSDPSIATVENNKLWLPTSQDAVEFYGLHVVVENPLANVLGSITGTIAVDDNLIFYFDTQITYHLMFKNTK